MMDKEKYKYKGKIKKDSDEEIAYILDLLGDIFKRPLGASYDHNTEEYNEEDYVKIDYGVTSFKDCIVVGYDNVIDMDSYRLYKMYIND